MADIELLLLARLQKEPERSKKGVKGLKQTNGEQVKTFHIPAYV